MYSPGLGPGRVRSPPLKNKKNSNHCFFYNNFEQCFKQLLKPFFSTINSNNASNNCSSNCFLFEQCAREGGCQGAARRDNSLLFQTGGRFFFNDFHDTIFFTKKRKSPQTNY